MRQPLPELAYSQASGGTHDVEVHRADPYLLSFAILAGGLAVAADAVATPIAAEFVQAFRPPNTPTGLPALLEGGAGSITLQFHIPDANQILSINSIEVSVDVFDDADPARNPEESGVVRLGIDGPNLDISAFGDLSGPLTVTGFVAPGDLPAAEDELTDDGFFRIRVRRDTGDFFVGAARVNIDANLAPAVPAPPSILCLAAGAVALLASRRRLLGKPAGR